MNYSSFYYQSPLGTIEIKASDHFVESILFCEDDFISSLFSSDNHPLIERVCLQLDRYFQHDLNHFDLPLNKHQGTDFQHDVWNALEKISHGHTTTYQNLASAIERTRAVRAVGSACGKNPFHIVIPCHRVLASSGALGGYKGGLDKKIALLQLEGYVA